MTTTNTGLVQVRITDHDFEHLWHTATSWGPTFQEHQDEWERFAVYHGPKTLTVPLHSDIYWIDEYASLILARAYVEAQGWEYIVASDEGMDDNGNCGGWVIILPGITTQHERSQKALAEYEAKKKAVWAVWNTLGDHHPTPVKTIAKELGLSNYEVAVIVYPPQKYGLWKDDQEPDL